MRSTNVWHTTVTVTVTVTTITAPNRSASNVAQGSERVKGRMRRRLNERALLEVEPGYGDLEASQRIHEPTSGRLLEALP